MDKYDHKKIEKKWQEKWDESKIFVTDINSAKNPFFNLMMFPYPSAEGLHIGSVYTFSGVDTFGRFQAMKGHEVFEPIGLDGFGIHSENFAIKIGEHIKDVSKRTEKHFYEQMKATGNMYDWSRTVETYKPDYYKWTQWLFTELYKAGLAVRKKSKVNWCPGCKTVLSDEQVIDGRCERSGDEVEQREMNQWFFKITDYTQRLLSNLDWIDWSEDVKVGQKNWIGKKEGINITYKIKGLADDIVCFTTRPDTNFGATFIVIAPEHPFVQKIIDKEIKVSKETYDQIQSYRAEVEKKSELDRISEGKNKSGVFTGFYAINNLNGKEIPIWISDFVLGHFGTGAVVGVPAHDMRDFEFAKVFDIPVLPVLKPKNLKNHRSFIIGVEESFIEDLQKQGIVISEKTEEGYRVEVPKEKINLYKKLVRENLKQGYWNELIGDDIWFVFKDKKGAVIEYILDQENWDEIAKKCSEFNNDPIEKTQNLYLYLASNEWYTPIMIQEEEGIMFNSEFLDGLDVNEAIEKMKDHLEEKGWGKRIVNYNLRDWCVSRQRYWGPPIPMLNIGKSKVKSQKSKLKVLVLHGTSGSSKINWFQWLKSKLAEEEIEVAVPDLPDTNNPSYKERMEYLSKNYSDFLDENSIVIGHSLGASTALHLAEKFNLKGLILVAPYVYSRKDRFQKFAETFSEETAKAVVKYHEQGYDFKKINKNTGWIVTLAGAKDAWVTSDYIEFLRTNLPDSRIKIYPDKSHLSANSDGMTSFPDLLNYITDEVWTTVPEEDLPVLLPDIPRFEDILPDGSGKGPLEKQEDFVNVSSKYGDHARRETDVSDPFVDSCWYFLRYPFVGNDKMPFEFVTRPKLGEEVEVDPKFIEAFKEVYKALEEAGTFPMVNGSLLVTALNGQTFTDVSDIDLSFNSEEYFKKAKSTIEKLGYKFEKTGEYRNEKFSKGDIVIDLSYNWPQSYLGYKVKLFDQKVRIFEPRLIREFYVKDKTKNKLKIEILDNWINQKINKWFPVTYYIGGKEHTVLHLLYARFITMVFNDLGYLDFEEPFAKFYGHGLITKDGAKMSKSKGNVINPDEYFEKFGADPVRLYLRFLGPFDQGGDWRDTGMSSMWKFVSRMWEIYSKFVSQDMEFGSGNDVNMSKLHFTVKKVAEELSELKFNTAVAKIMELINWYKENEGSFNKDQVEEILEKLTLMLAPLMPHLAEELWENLNKSKNKTWKWSVENSVHRARWPEFDEKILQQEQAIIAVQINGKMRGTVEAGRDSSQEEIMKLVNSNERFTKYNISNNKKVIFVPNKIINIIV